MNVITGTNRWAWLLAMWGVLATCLAGCDALRLGAVNPPTGQSPQSAILTVVLDESSIVTETVLTGMVDDPVFGDEPFDLSSQPVFATAWVLPDVEDVIEVRIEAPRVATVGANNIVIRLHDIESATMTARAMLIQATDTNAYDPCERTAYDYEFCERTLYATEGAVVLAGFSSTPGEETVISGTFAFDTLAGRVEGSFRAAGLVAESDYSTRTP